MISSIIVYLVYSISIPLPAIQSHGNNGKIKTHHTNGFYNNSYLDDLDGNGTHDFQEAGTAASNNNVCPSDVTTTVTTDATFTANATPNGKVKYTWQESFDNGTSWRNLDDPLINEFTNKDGDNWFVLQSSSTRYRWLS